MIISLVIVVAIFTGIYAFGGWKAVGIGVLVYLLPAVWMRGRRSRRKWPYSGSYVPGRHDPFTHAADRYSRTDNELRDPLIFSFKFAQTTLNRRIWRLLAMRRCTDMKLSCACANRRKTS